MLPPVRARAIARARRGGYSLVEILVVLAIIGLLTGAIGFALFQHFTRARIETSRQNAVRIRTAVQMYRMSHTGDSCPTVGGLVAEQILDSGTKQTDAWDHPFAIQCSDEGEIRVVSPGPDGRLDTPDDIVVPVPAAPSPLPPSNPAS